MIYLIGLVGIIGFVIVGRFFAVPALSPRPDNLGWRGANEGFKHCPDAMNCVSTTADQNTRFYIEPIPFSGTVEAANLALVDVINNMPRTEIVSNTGDYIYTEYTSLTMGFIDDTEFYFDTENNVIQVRSASRLGYGDAGVNRKRVETIRQQFEG